MEITSKPNSLRKNKTGGWRTYRPNFSRERCIACGQCAQVCPEGIIEKFEDKNKPYYRPDLEYCKGCGICAEICPAKAIKMEMDKK